MQSCAPGEVNKLTLGEYPGDIYSLEEFLDQVRRAVGASGVRDGPALDVRGDGSEAAHDARGLIADYHIETKFRHGVPCVIMSHRVTCQGA